MIYRNHFLVLLSTREAAQFKPHLVEISVKAGQRVQRAGEPIEHVYFLHNGVASLSVPTARRIGILGAIACRASVIGGVAAFGLDIAVTDATVQIAGNASRMGVDKFRTTLRQCDDLLRETILRAELFGMAQAQQAAACNALHAAEARICRTLLELHDRVDGQRIPITQAILADLLGVQRTTVTLIFRKLQSSGALLCRRGHVHLIDRAAVERHACECYGRLRERFEQLMPEQRRASRLDEAWPLASQAGATMALAQGLPARPRAARPRTADSLTD